VKGLRCCHVRGEADVLRSKHEKGRNPDVPGGYNFGRGSLSSRTVARVAWQGGDFRTA
jgi:hypothetical protein